MAREERNDLEELAIALANAKKTEDEAKAARIAAEEALASAIGGRDIGSTSVKCGQLNVTVKRGFNYKIDQPLKFAEQYPDFVKRTEKIEIYAKAYESLRETDPNGLFAEIAAHITATPKKVSVELKL